MKSFINKYYLLYLPFILFFGLIIIDSFNGYSQASADTHSPIGMLCRGMILASILPFLLKKTSLKYIKLFKILFILYLLLIPLWILNHSGLNISIEIQNIFRFVYFFAVLTYFQRYVHSFTLNKCCKYITLSALILAIINIVCAITGIGNKSYGDDFGFGTKAFYADGNSFGLYMILSNCIAIWFAFYRKKLWFIAAILVSIGTLLIGSRTAMAGVAITWFLLLTYFIIKKDRIVKLSSSSKIIICMFGGSAIIYVIYKMFELISTFDAYTIEKFTIESAFSSRDFLISLGKSVIRNFNFFELFIGKSFSGGMKAVGSIYSSNTELKSMETDWLDMILYYGWGFGSLMIILQILIFSKLAKPFIKRRTSLNFTLLIIGILWMGTSWMAGHAFNNTMLAPLFAILLLISQNKEQYYAEKRLK